MKLAIERSPETTEAWIIGSGMSALASAVYLVEIAKVPPQRVHIWDHNVSLGDVTHPEGDSVHGYDQFGGCLPVPVGAPLRELLALVPSARKPAQSQSVLDEIVSCERDRNGMQKNRKVNFLVQKKGKLESLSSHSSIQFNERQQLARFLFKCERRMKRKRICDFFPDSFFQSFFWAILSIQYGSLFPLLRKCILMFAVLIQIWFPTLAWSGRIQAGCAPISPRVPQLEHSMLFGHHRVLPVRISIHANLSPSRRSRRRLPVQRADQSNRSFASKQAAENGHETRLFAQWI
jgi:hypothetical protein